MRIKFVPVGEASDAVIDRNKDNCDRLGLPRIQDAGPVAQNLAVVGGSPSVAKHVDELARWNGEIWAINGAFHWLRSVGIEATFFSISPTETTVPHARGAKKAILANTCSPSLYEILKDAEVEVANLGPDLPHGSTGACTAPVIAAWRGHQHVTLFGCESSFADKTHAYDGSPTLDGRLLVRCGDRDYLTTPQFYMQAEYLAELIRGVSHFVEARGDGLLNAMAEHGQWNIEWVSRAIREAVEREKAKAAA